MNTIFDWQRILYSIANESYIRSATQLSAIVNATICERQRRYLRFQEHSLLFYMMHADF